MTGISTRTLVRITSRVVLLAALAVWAGFTPTMADDCDPGQCPSSCWYRDRGTCTWEGDCAYCDYVIPCDCGNMCQWLNACEPPAD
jgi:hypothetical protein